MKLRVACVIVGLALGVTACGGGGSSKTVAQPTVSSPPVVSATPTPTQDPLSNSKNYTYNMGSSNGYTETVRLDVGKLQRFIPNQLHNGSLMAGTGCTINPQKDAVIPIRLTVANTTTGNFTVPINGGIVFRTASEAPEVEASFSSPTCEQATTGASGWGKQQEVRFVTSTSNSPILVLDGYLVIKDYYSPLYPDGNTALFTPSSKSSSDPNYSDTPHFQVVNSTSGLLGTNWTDLITHDPRGTNFDFAPSEGVFLRLPE